MRTPFRQNTILSVGEHICYLPEVSTSRCLCRYIYGVHYDVLYVMRMWWKMKMQWLLRLLLNPNTLLWVVTIEKKYQFLRTMCRVGGCVGSSACRNVGKKAFVRKTASENERKTSVTMKVINRRLFSVWIKNVKHNLKVNRKEDEMFLDSSFHFMAVRGMF